MKHVCILSSSRKACFAAVLRSIRSRQSLSSECTVGVTKSWLSKQHKYAALSRAFYATVSKRQCILFMKYNWCEHDRFGHFDDFEITFTHGQGWLQALVQEAVFLSINKSRRNAYKLFCSDLDQKVDRSIKIPLCFLLIFKFNNHRSV